MPNKDKVAQNIRYNGMTDNHSKNTYAFHNVKGGNTAISCRELFQFLCIGYEKDKI